jgi:hypothetical protein
MCGKQFIPLHSNVKKGRGKYCSKECYLSYIRRHLKPQLCRVCGKGPDEAEFSRSNCSICDKCRLVQLQEYYNTERGRIKREEHRRASSKKYIVKMADGYVSGRLRQLGLDVNPTTMALVRARITMKRELKKLRRILDEPNSADVSGQQCEAQVNNERQVQP